MNKIHWLFQIKPLPLKRNGELLSPAKVMRLWVHTSIKAIVSFVTRCCRLGKSMEAKMLCAYYDKETK